MNQDEVSLKTNDSNELPSVSMIIPVHNDPEGLRMTLESIIAQDYPESQMEVLVVDNNSNDNTFDLAKSFKSEHPGMIMVLQEMEIQSSYAARNKAIEEATGDIVCFTDADVTMNSDWLRKSVDSMIRKSSSYFGCKVLTHIVGKPNIFSVYSQLTAFPNERYISKDKFAPTCCLCVTKALLDEVGNFDQQLVSGGDWEFGNRVYERGYKLDYDPSIEVYHPSRSSLRSLIKKQIRIGRGQSQLKRMYPKRYARKIGSPLGLANILPPNPFIIIDDLSEKVQPKMRDIILVFSIGYFLKIAKVIGRMREERIQSHWSTR